MGKSQFCNFVQKDITNSINKVSDSLNSCTQDPFSNNFKRNNINYEFIDTAGSADSSGGDVENLKKLVDYLKIKQSIDFILLLLKFGERVTNDTREYIKTLGKMFTPSEFYTHLSVIFTKFPNKPSKKEEKIKNKSIEEINVIIKNSFNIEVDEITPKVKVYFIDTEYDEDENTYDQKSQDTIDIIMEQIKLNVYNFGSINTTNLDIVGDSVKNRLAVQQKEIEKLQQLVEQEKLKKINEENEKKRIQDELKEIKLDNEKRKEKEIELQQLINKQKERERQLKEFEYNNMKIAEENRRKQQLIEEEARKKGIIIEELDNSIKNYKKASKISFWSSLGLIGLSAGIVAFDIFLIPITGPLLPIAEAVFYSGSVFGVTSGIASGTTYGIARYKEKKKEEL